jgi:hypothetical protein
LSVVTDDVNEDVPDVVKVVVAVEDILVVPVLDCDVVAVLVMDVVNEAVPDDVPLVEALVVADDDTVELAVVLADVVMVDDALDEIDVVADEDTVDDCEVVAEDDCEVVADDDCEVVADDDCEVVADDVTEDDPVLDWVDVCVVCLHSKNVPARCRSIASLTRFAVVLHFPASAESIPSSVHPAVPAATPSLKMALPVILLSDAATFLQGAPFPPS